MDIDGELYPRRRRRSVRDRGARGGRIQRRVFYLPVHTLRARRALYGHGGLFQFQVPLFRSVGNGVPRSFRRADGLHAVYRHGRGRERNDRYQRRAHLMGGGARARARGGAYFRVLRGKAQKSRPQRRCGGLLRALADRRLPVCGLYFPQRIFRAGLRRRRENARLYVQRRGKLLRGNGRSRRQGRYRRRSGDLQRQGGRRDRLRRAFRRRRERRPLRRKRGSSLQQCVGAFSRLFRRALC